MMPDSSEPAGVLVVLAVACSPFTQRQKYTVGKGRRRLAVGAAVAVLGAYGCASTTYTPRPDGRVAVTVENGSPRFTKNGTSVTASVYNLQQVVTENPAAAEQARQSASDLRTGLVLDLGGLAATIAGAVVIAPATNTDGTRRAVSDARVGAGSALVLGGFIAIFGAVHYLASAQARQLDAINIYNDGVAAWPPRGTAGPPVVVSPVPLVRRQNATPSPPASPTAVPELPGPLP
jgi:hypothetical protein